MLTNSVHRHNQSIQRFQHLEPADMCSRLELYRWINGKSHTIRNIFFTDEAHFIRDGVNNTRNTHLWVRDSPHGTVEKQLPKLLFRKSVVWCHW